jgi:nitric oxide reductase NorD protein
MEEKVGEIWHNLITRWARSGYPDAAVGLADVAQTAGILFRALGGDPGLQMEAASPREHGGHRGWLQRIAGSGRKVRLAWRDERALRLPSVIDCFPDKALNRELYLWLAALAAEVSPDDGNWLTRSQRMTGRTLSRFPGLLPRYRRLVEAHIAQRPPLERLSPAQARRERNLRQALREPGSVTELPPARGEPQPVPLWLHPAPPIPSQDGGAPDPDGTPAQGPARMPQTPSRQAAERIDAPEGQGGLVTIRMENILSWAEFVRVDRSSEDNEDLDQAADIGQDLDKLSLARERRACAGRLKLDLDLPAEANDDLILSNGVLLPEWDHRQQRLRPEYCRALPLLAADAVPCELPDQLRGTARRLRSQFQALAPARQWIRGQPDGREIDLEAYLRFAAERRTGHPTGGDTLYRDLRTGARDLVCLLMADLSLSTDTWVDDYARVIDVIRDSLFLFAESLAATGDRFGIYGFSSRRRDPVRIHRIKGFDEPYSRHIRGRIQAIKPGYYTRMGAAIRYATGLLEDQPAERRLLLLLSDGKPNDLDIYEGRYGIEDTRHAVQQAHRSGLQPFCVTIDERGNDYLPHLFGNGGYLVIRRPSELPRKLPLLYARLTA